MKNLDRSTRRAVRRALVDFVIDDAMLRSGRLRRLGKRVVRAQQYLRNLVDDEAWAAYLTLEDVTNAKSSKQLRLVFDRMLAVYAATVI